MTYKDFIAKYGMERVKFSSYYKFSFTFISEDKLLVGVGGSADDIYKLDIGADKEYTVAELEPEWAYLVEECLSDEWE